MMSYYGPNITEIATLSLAHFSKGDMGLAIVAMIAWQAVFFWAGYQVYRKASKDAASQFSLLPFYKPARDFASKPIRFLVLNDMAVAYFLAMLSGIKPNPQSCGIVATSMLVVSVAYLGYVVGLRPYHSKIDQGLVIVNALLQITLSALNLATIHNEGLLTTLGPVEFAALCYSYVQITILIVNELIKKYEKYKEAREKTIKMDNASVLSLPNIVDMQPPDRDTLQVSPTPLSNSILDAEQIMLDDEQAVEPTNATIAINIGPIFEASVNSLVQEKPESVPFSFAEDLENSHTAIEMSPQPLIREESPQLEDSTDSEKSEAQGISRSPENDSEESTKLESQLLAKKTNASLPNSQLSFFYLNPQITQTPKMANNNLLSELDFL